MLKVATQQFNTVQKLKNLTTKKGKVANSFAQGLKDEGYNHIYQRPWIRDSIVVSGKNANGDTKTFILSYGGYKVKTNNIKPVTSHTSVREIDKAYMNEFGREISGAKKIQRLINNKIFDTNIEKRGWGIKG